MSLFWAKARNLMGENEESIKLLLLILRSNIINQTDSPGLRNNYQLSIINCTQRPDSQLRQSRHIRLLSGLSV